jgi:hypothetical protein
MSCPKGIITDLRYFGAIPLSDGTLTLKAEGPFANWHENERLFGANYCGNPEHMQDEDRCDDIFSSSFKDNFNQICVGQEECKFNLVKNIQTSKNLKCNDENTIVYAQVTCEMSGEQMVLAQQHGCIIIFLAFVMCLLYFERLTQRADNSKMREKKYDMETCTVADYSIRINLTDEVIAEFEKEKRANRSNCIIKYLSVELERQVATVEQIIKVSDRPEDDVEDLGYEKVSKFEIKVAAIALGYKNRQVIIELRKRGAKLGADASFEAIETIESTINTII